MTNNFLLTIQHMIIFFLALSCTSASPRKTQRYQTCEIENKWVYKIVKITSGNTLVIAEVPENILKNVNQTCVDDIFDAIKEGGTFADITKDIKRAKESSK
ncbi:MAG: hypothetical protein K9K67_13310 [Bacteriovoracaceae bacterium]|nr:hypothetical protein [Bacteriovoracaceae bacterium]